MDILKLYTSLLNAGHMTADENGVIHRQIKGLEDKKTPVLVKLANNERATMVLPIKLQTDLPNWSHRVVFHPLRENTQRGESLVMEKYRINMLDRINAASLVMMLTMLKLAGDPSLQTGLSPDQLSYLAQLPDADAKALKTFNEITVKCAVTDKPLWAFTKHSGIKDGVVYRRLCSVRAPMLEAIANAADRKVKGVQLRVTDIPLFKTLYSLVFPQAVETNFDYYSQGSNSVRAPSMDAFMKSVRLIAENINDLAILFDTAEPGLADNLMFDMAWTDVLEDIDAYSPKILLIPAMPGNEGRVLNERAEMAKEVTLPWEPASAPPSGMVEDNAGGYKPATSVVTPAPQARQEQRAPSYTGGYPSARPSTPAIVTTAPVADDAIENSPFYQMRERERQQQAGGRNYGGRYQDNPATANGYPEQNNYGGRNYGSGGRPGYNDRNDSRSYSGRRTSY